MNIQLVRVHAVAPDTAHARRFSDSENVIETLTPDVPVLCFSPSALQQQAQLFLRQFPGESAYALKANPDPCVITTLFDNGIKTFDVASPTEMALVARYAPGAKMHYHNPVKSRDEITAAYHKYGCRRFAVDSVEELTKIAQVIGADKGVEIAVRFRLPAAANSVHDFSTKFGASPSQANELLRVCNRHGYIPLVTFHPGSQCHDMQGWVRHIKVAAQIARDAGVTLNKLNIGGGFPAHYQNMNVPALGDIFDVIKAALKEAFPDAPPTLECEPGRALVASCVSLITRVKAVRRNAAEIFLNDGIYGSLMETAQAPALTPRHRVIQNRNAAPNERREELFTIFGPTCDPLDCLPLPLKLPMDICEGEYVEFLGVGAYGSATATGFNGYGGVERVEIS